MGKVSKRVASILYMKEHETLFSCPLCKESMHVTEDGHVTCGNRHSFDIAKQGYVNFMIKPATSMYSKSLFESRQEIINSGLYNPLQQTIAKHIGSEVRTILDTGCGEGSHLERIGNLLTQDIVAVGIDISKEGIQSAAKFYEQKIWCVGDLANSPYKKQSIDCILNILSPANYEEFSRLLKPKGKVIKVVPQSDYLKEIRKQAFANSEKESYSNEQTVQRFKEHFTNVLQERITYTMPLEPMLVPKLLEMTPLGWHLEEGISLTEITIDLDVLVGELSKV
ncbi:putative RNA methyltransferase [Ureibacillus chungkukjangi]|uniref:23S rRNA m(1)G-748 methyltransferase n=1 Tax=Ureibacillus chungkukjangi TaxID=1202712 RepID=A0A318TP37_9BACL|nr:methyltransferase domain-containing protein [Ureibacillus chungkukjangi]MCM3388714.1 methyltransferase domain-containing protein [Ureibacillus chungkukjangi]PYF06622.1 23S rRNA m(1)G-748 methyltransferase [Ureibacillus chungkukjangi]